MEVFFETQCDLRAMPNSKWMLIAPLLVRIEEGDRKRCRIEVPQWFETDLASVPRFPLVFLVFGGSARASSVLHDWLYTAGHDRAWSDRAFLAAMKAEGEPAWRRAAMWLGVRIFGWVAHGDG